MINNIKSNLQDSNKRILCLIDSLGPGGAQRQLVGLSVCLKESGYKITVAFYHENLFFAEHLKNIGVPYLFLSKARKSAFRIWHVARYTRHAKPDVVISYLETPSICACMAKLFNRSFKLIVSERNTTQHTGWKEQIRFTLFRLADFVVSNSYSQEAYLRVAFPKLADKIVTIPNFVDLEYFIPPKICHRNKVPEVMVAATIWPSKNTLGFIDALALMKSKGIVFHVSWYGASADYSDYLEQCMNKIEQFGLADYIVLKEKTEKILECYQNADIFCLPSFYEGTPNVICEAMACGLPILCSDVCDNARYVIDGENGYLFNPKNTESIVAAFEKIFSLGEENYGLFCCNSLSMARNKFSKKSFVNAYMSLL